MIESRRRAYLEVMGYDIWTSRMPKPDSDRLVLQQGEGDTLLVCSSPDAVGGSLTDDIARALGKRVVWAWPDPEGRKENPGLDEAVGQYLFTRVVVFGAELLGRFFKGDVPVVIGSARILAASSIEGLVASGRARHEFWNLISGKTHN
jgi:hypothetical protein